MQQHGQSPRRRKLMLYFTYGVMTMAVAIISTICILLVLGYRFDFKNGDVEQGALLQFRSFPAGANINLDSEVLSFVTPGKRNVDVGRHSVTMQLDGYKSWQKDFSVAASELRWLNYARLIPETVDTSATREFASIDDHLPSPDKKWIMALPAAGKPEFTLIDIRDQEETKFTQLTLPSGSYTVREGQPHMFEILEWDFGARYVLVKHTVADVVEYIRVDRTDAQQTLNVSGKLDVKLEDIHFSGTSGNLYYALENGSIRKLDSAAGTISQPIVKDVANFRIYKESTLAYVKKPLEDKIGVGIVTGGKASRVATYDASQAVSVDINEYFSDYYLAIGRGSTVEVYKDPELDTRKKLKTITTSSAIAWLRLGSSGRFVVAGNGSQFTTYDVETDEVYNVNLPGTAADPAKPLQWLDDYYLVSTADNDLRITEFDGANQHVITSTLPGSAVTLNDNGRFLYSFNRTQNGGYVLQASRMTINR